MVNLDIQDNHEEATLGAFLICEMCQAVSTKCNLSSNFNEHQGPTLQWAHGGSNLKTCRSYVLTSKRGTDVLGLY